MLAVDMDSLLLLLPITLVSLTLLSFLWRREISSRKKLQLPPGPPGWPIVGNIFQMGKRPHESLKALSLKYGPLMTLRLGMKTTVVVSSPDMAKQVLKTHDNVLAGRMTTEAFKTLSHDKFSVVFSEPGPYWRNLRRISAVELFSAKRLDGPLQHLRRDQVFRMTRLLFEDMGNVVDIGQIAFCTTLNVLGRMFFSTSVYDPTSSSPGMKDVVTDLMAVSGKPNLVDFFPFLRFLDPQGVNRDMTTHFKAMYDFCDEFIEKKLAARSQSNTELEKSDKDFLDVLLDFTSEDFTLAGVRVFLTELFVAGTDSSTLTIEWAIAELIRHPEKLKRLRKEMDEVVGRNRRVEESDLDRLPYLHAVFKEILRIYPPALLLVPRKAESSCEIGGYVIPKNTQVLVNVWAIGRDPSVWENASEFIPERFLEADISKIAYGGQNFELIPFGAGRRICPGLPLAIRIVQFMVASLVHSFEWTLPDGVPCEELDMTEKSGLSLKKAKKLNAIPTPRLPHHVY